VDFVHNFFLKKNYKFRQLGMFQSSGKSGGGGGSTDWEEPFLSDPTQQVLPYHFTWRLEDTHFLKCLFFF
jgi:hypothetical protein